MVVFMSQWRNRSSSPPHSHSGPHTGITLKVSCTWLYVAHRPLVVKLSVGYHC